MHGTEGPLPLKPPTARKGLSLPKGRLLKSHCSGWIYLIFNTKKICSRYLKFYFYEAEDQRGRDRLEPGLPLPPFSHIRM